MIKFFSRIGQKLLAENRFSKYLICAIGEIVLVIIGILIVNLPSACVEHGRSMEGTEGWVIA